MLVGTANNSGYLKNYSYDQRMKYQSPPFFLNPIDSAWQIVTWVECKGTQQRRDPERLPVTLVIPVRR